MGTAVTAMASFRLFLLPGPNLHKAVIRGHFDRRIGEFFLVFLHPYGLEHFSHHGPHLSNGLFHLYYPIIGSTGEMISVVCFRHNQGRSLEAVRNGPPCDSIKGLSPSPCLTHFLPVGAPWHTPHLAHKFFLCVMSITLSLFNSKFQHET